MSKAVMLSIQPKWCELIASGKKTEVRKSRPSIETPFKCYIYCTKGKEHLITIFHKGEKVFCDDENSLTFDKTIFVKNTSFLRNPSWQQKIIGEFVCDYIDEYKYSVANYGGLDIDCQQLDDTCLTKQQIEEYANGKNLYGWHISNLVIYDKPRELGEFKTPCPTRNQIDGDCKLCKHAEISLFGKMPKCKAYLTRPPQSWCYVEEV